MKFFALYSPTASQHMWSTCPQSCECPPEKKLFGVAFNQLCTASIKSLSSANLWPRKYSFTGPMAPIPDCMVDVSTPPISEHAVYPLHAQPYGHGRCRKAIIHFLREVSDVSITSRASTRSLACHCIDLY